MKKNLIIALMLVLFYGFSFAKEKILEKKDYPNWVENIFNPPENYWGIEFGENEVLDKIIENNNYLFVYSHDDENNYVCKTDKNGNPLKNEAYRLKDNSIDFIIENFEQFPFRCKYEKYFYYDEEGKISNFVEYFFLNDLENHIYKENDKLLGTFIYKYEKDRTYSRTCTRVGDDDGYIYSYIGSICYYDKDDNLLSCFTNDENKKWRYYSGSKEFKEFVKKYEIKLPKENTDISIIYETYKNGSQSLFWIDFSKDGWNKKNYLMDIIFGETFYWYDEEGRIGHGKDLKDEWWNTYQNGKLIYRKAQSGDTYFDYDEKGNIILEKRKYDDRWYIDEYKYDNKNRLIWSFIKEIDIDENIISSVKQELQYDNDDFVIYVKWVTNGDLDGKTWYSKINGYEFTNIKDSIEYKFEKINDRQIKIIPQDGKHWFIGEISNDK